MAMARLVRLALYGMEFISHRALAFEGRMYGVMESCETTFSVTQTNIPPSAQQHQNQGSDWTPHSLNSTRTYPTPVCTRHCVVTFSLCLLPQRHSYATQYSILAITHLLLKLTGPLKSGSWEIGWPMRREEKVRLVWTAPGTPQCRLGWRVVD